LDNLKEVREPEDSRAKFKALLFSIGMALFLTIVKFVVGILSFSMAVLASAVDSLMDVLVSSVNFLALKEADKPADAEHLYGHGKIESLAGLFQSLLIGASGLYLVYESIRRLLLGTEVSYIPVAIGVMILSMGCSFLVVRRLKHVGHETSSMIVRTETLHFTTDLLMNGGVIVGLLLVQWTGFGVWDLVVALVLAGYIVKQSLHILKAAVDELLDRALPKEKQNKIESIILNFDPHIIGFHNLRTRKIGRQNFIDFHLEIRGEENFARAHELTEALILKITDHFPGADVTVHYDPEGGD